MRQRPSSMLSGFELSGGLQVGLPSGGCTIDSVEMVNKELARGIGSNSRSKSYHRRGLWAVKKKNGGKFPSHPKKEKKAEAPSKARLGTFAALAIFSASVRGMNGKLEHSL